MRGSALIASETVRGQHGVSVPGAVATGSPSRFQARRTTTRSLPLPVPTSTSIHALPTSQNCIDRGYLSVDQSGVVATYIRTPRCGHWIGFILWIRIFSHAMKRQRQNLIGTRGID